jgi:hypothetical protein
VKEARSDTITLKGRIFTTPMLLSPELAEHVAEPTIIIRSNTTSVFDGRGPGLDNRLVHEEDDETKPEDEGEPGKQPRRARMLGRLSKGLLRMLRVRNGPPAPVRAPVPAPVQRGQLSPTGKSMTNSLRIPKRPTTLDADEAPEDSILPEPHGHTVYTDVFLSSWTQKGTAKFANEDRYFATTDLWKYNNDPTISQPHTALVGVFDGHGGPGAAELCAREIPKAVRGLTNIVLVFPHSSVPNAEVALLLKLKSYVHVLRPRCTDPPISTTLTWTYLQF